MGISLFHDNDNLAKILFVITNKDMQIGSAAFHGITFSTRTTEIGFA
ncbi:MAG: hypothetical protein HN600_03360 [Bacteroidetes bacterium]|jgi:hypothetical protein|nr:hypothetical protein [Cytophagia bacterium]MBT7825610.1 hypothetical protein [Bacteroidota bacterium]